MLNESMNVLMNAKVAIADVLACKEISEWKEMEILRSIAVLLDDLYIRADELAPVDKH